MPAGGFPTWDAGQSRRTTWAGFVALHGGFVAAWVGRAFGPTWLYDAGLVTAWLTAAGLFILLGNP